MTEDDITNWAREAGLIDLLADGVIQDHELERFARAVAAHTRHAPVSIYVAESALEQERARGRREGVAAENMAWRKALEPAFRERMGAEQVLEIVQRAIRARSTP